ncbi:unnamed protein product [Cylicostephanus goldi]|uniref:Uncharacterized protein n=1 Tax=Cylicostephanus goldi TaxID=71465 RepID=A0A3P7N1D8_CYLGO|nr:unnamed protein product [Cylicostephanus goldi]
MGNDPIPVQYLRSMANPGSNRLVSCRLSTKIAHSCWYETL